MASVVSGSVTIGGTVFGAVEADVKLDDGTSWHYAGYYADCGAGVGVCNSPTGDFPGESHMSGSCFMSVIQVPGGFGVSFDDFHGHIGTLGGVFEGALIELGVGGGAWTEESSEEEHEALKAGDKLDLELHHEFVSTDDEDSDK
jgi:hypothetical protein